MIEPQSSSTKKKYNNFENVLQYINKSVISLPNDETKLNNEIMNNIVNQVLDKMKEKSSTFKQHYVQLFYGGSYYDGLKITKPEEYDLDLLFKLSKTVQIDIKSLPDESGFVSFEIKENSENIPKEFLDGDNYISRNKVLTWMESTLSKTLQEFPSSGDKYIAKYKNTDIFMKISKNGPAFTLKLNGMVNEKTINIYVDLVPCFCIDSGHWPTDFTPNPTQEKNFFLVPKQSKNPEPKVGISWRLSFQKQEKMLLSNNKVLKPSLKLLKKLRDKLQHVCIASYFIKTVFLLEISKKEKTFWDNSLSFVFVEMLKSYMGYIQCNNIPYYWNENHNLLQGISIDTLTNIGNRLQNIYEDLHKNLHNPMIIANIYLSGNEIENMKNTITLSKKSIRSASHDNMVANCEPAEENPKEDYKSLKETMFKMSTELQVLKEDNRILLEMMRTVLSKLDSLENHCKKININGQFKFDRPAE